MRAAFAELLGINASAGLLKLLSGDQSESQIRCAVADFNVSGGTATARTFVIDTDVVLAQGKGSINLGAETMNLRIEGESKKPRLLRLWAPITVWPPDRAQGRGRCRFGGVAGRSGGPVGCGRGACDGPVRLRRSGAGRGRRLRPVDRQCPLIVDDDRSGDPSVLWVMEPSA